MRPGHLDFDEFQNLLLQHERMNISQFYDQIDLQANKEALTPKGPSSVYDSSTRPLSCPNWNLNNFFQKNNQLY